MGLAPVAGFGVLGVVVYAGFPTIVGGVIAGLLLLAGLWAGYSIFKKVQIVGPFELMAAIRASPDMDNLVPGPNSQTRLLTAHEFADKVKNELHHFRGGAMRIYGDWFGRPYTNMHRLIGTDYDPELNVLTMTFSEGETLSIRDPKHIFDSSTMMKILHADSIRLDFLHSSDRNEAKKEYYLTYTRTKSKVQTETNVDWYSPHFDTSAGDPALVIFGRFDEHLEH